MKRILLTLAFLVALILPGFAEQVTVNFSELYSADTEVKNVQFGDSNISIVFAGGGTNAKYYKSGTAVRVYASNTLTVAAIGEDAANVTIKAINFTYTQGKFPKTDVGALDSNGNWSGEFSSVTLTNSGSSQVRLSEIVVDYEISDAPVEPTEPGEDHDATIVFSQLGYANAAKITTVEFDGGLITCAKSSGSSDPAYYTTGSGLRLYKDNTMTVAASAGTIVNIEFTFDGASTSFTTSAKCSTGEMSGQGTTTVTWTGDANSVVFTSDRTVRLQKMVITYKASGTTTPDPDKTAVELAWSEEAVELTEGDTFVAPTLTVTPEEARELVTYSSDNAAVASIDANGAVTINGVGEAKITAAVAANDTFKSATASYTITVNKAIAAGENEATIVFKDLGYANATNVTNVAWEGGTATFSAGTNSSTPPKYYTSGTACRVYNGNTFTISASEGAAISKIVFTYNTPNSLNASTTVSTGTFSNTTSTWTGDASEVIFSVKNTAHIQTITITYNVPDATKTTPKMTWSVDAVNILRGDEFTAPTLAVDPEAAKALVKYTTSNAAVATVAEDGTIALVGAAGSATITATIDADDNYNRATASCPINVTGAAINVAEAMAVADKAKVILNFPLTVGYANGVNIWAADATGDWIYIYKSGAKYSYANGDVIAAGWEATKSPYNGLTEFEPTTAIGEVTKGGEPLIFAEVEAISEDMMNSIVVFKNVTVASTPEKTTFIATAADGKEYTFYHKFTSIDLPDAGVYNVTGIVNSNNALQFVPLSYEQTGKYVKTPAYKFAVESMTVYQGENDDMYELPALNNVPEGLELTYTTSNAEVAEVDEDGIIYIWAPGTVTITASNEATDEYNAYSTSFTLNILDADSKPVQVTFDFTKDGAYGMTVQSNSNSYEKEVKSFREEGVTISMAGNYRLWSNSGKVEFRVHKNATLTITADNEYLIKAVSFTSAGTQSKYKDFTNSTYENGVSSLSFTGTDTNQLNTITVTLVKREVPELEAEFGHDLYLDEQEEVFYNTFTLGLILDDNGIGADHYTLALDGKLIDNNVELEEGLAMLELEYVPYQAVYSLTFTAIDAEGNAMGTYTYPVSHALDIENAMPVDLEQTFYYSEKEDGEIDIHLRITFDIDESEAGYEYYFATEGDASMINWEDKTMCMWQYTKGIKNGSNITIDTTDLPDVDLNVHTVFPMAHKELVVLEDTRAAAPRKVASQEEVVKSTQRSAAAAPIKVTANADDVQTGVEGISAEGTAEAEYYNLQGVRISEPAAGIYIRRQGGRTSKV
ncbi:MAG: Ig-like domain-containing protein, partial [Muribaculaceae bacterium]|nr:Ig-like domain-containing protein [Muribaculaceae bacterium]